MHSGAPSILKRALCRLKRGTFYTKFGGKVGGARAPCAPQAPMSVLGAFPVKYAMDELQNLPRKKVLFEEHMNSIRGRSGIYPDI